MSTDFNAYKVVIIRDGRVHDVQGRAKEGAREAIIARERDRSSPADDNTVYRCPEEARRMSDDHRQRALELISGTHV